MIFMVSIQFLVSVSSFMGRRGHEGLDVRIYVTWLYKERGGVKTQYYKKRIP